MKIILACEGKCEVTLIRSLLNKKELIFKNELLLDEPLHIRQLNELSYAINMLPIDEDIIVFRIGDTLTDELSFKGFELRKEHIKAFKICTKAEIEILIIINEGDYNKYLKEKSHVGPKEFIKARIKNFNFDQYIEDHDMLECIEKYKTLKHKKHKKDEYCLSDLINYFSRKY